MAKQFFVANHAGAKVLPAEQLATFAHYLQGVQFRFVVTRLDDGSISVTHRKSGKRVCAVSLSTLQSALGDYKIAAVCELKKLITRVGEARIRSVLAAAEA